jgi:hypothetical protein
LPHGYLKNLNEYNQFRVLEVYDVSGRHQSGNISLDCVFVLQIGIIARAKHDTESNRFQTAEMRLNEWFERLGQIMHSASYNHVTREYALDL